MGVLAKLSACTAAYTHWRLNDCTIFNITHMQKNLILISHLLSWLIFYKADSIIIESCHIYVIFEAAPVILLLIAYV